MWRTVAAGVDGGVVTLYPGRQWVRRWALDPARCARQGNPPVVGQLFTNQDGCDALLLFQNFGLSGSNPGVVRYTGFKRTLFYFATDTALWPDFFMYHCTFANGTYQCTNRFGDGLRWKPSATSPQGSGPLHLTDFLSADRKVWCGISDIGSARAFVPAVNRVRPTRRSGPPRCPAAAA